MNSIEINNLSKKYKDFSLENISFSLPSGTILGLVGENGAGKSTIINLIMNTISRDSGTVKVLDIDNKSKDFIETKQDIGVVLDEACFPEIITPNIVNKVMKNTYKNWNEDCYFKYIKRFNLPTDKKFKDFSKGMKMKLPIAVALSHDSKLLILDEATVGLDPMVRDEILDIFNEFTLDETHSVLISSHIISDLEKICDYIAFIHKGKLLFCEEKDRLLEEYAIVKVSPSAFEAIPKEAVKGVKTGKYGMEVLVIKSMISSAFIPEHTNLEDIILFLAKEENV